MFFFAALKHNSLRSYGGSPTPIPPLPTDIGRKNDGSSLLGNKFVIGKDGNKKEVVEKYRNWLFEEVKKEAEVYKELEKLAARAKVRDIKLGCLCKPEGCHSDVIKSCVEWLIRENKV